MVEDSAAASLIKEENSQSGKRFLLQPLTVPFADVASVNKEVKQGSTTTISCVITGITDTATVTWRTSTGQVSGSGFSATQGSHSGGTQTSTLAVDGTQVNVDTAYTCRVTSGSLPASGHFDTTVNLNVFGMGKFKSITTFQLKKHR